MMGAFLSKYWRKHVFEFLPITQMENDTSTNKFSRKFCTIFNGTFLQICHYTPDFSKRFILLFPFDYTRFRILCTNDNNNQIGGIEKSNSDFAKSTYEVNRMGNNALNTKIKTNKLINK